MENLHDITRLLRLRKKKASDIGERRVAHALFILPLNISRIICAERYSNASEVSML